MDASAPQLRDIKFNDAKRGYDPVEVDNFLDKLGDAVVKLEDKVREANRRADEAERRVSDAQRAASSAEKRALDAEAQVAVGGGSVDEDELAETLKKTLLLAQRTADETVKEAKADAATIAEEAEKKAARLVEDANTAAAKRLASVDDEIAARRAAETSELEAQVKRLEDLRVKLVADVEALEAHIEEVRGRIRAGADLLNEVLEDSTRLRPPTRPTLGAPPVETVVGDKGRPAATPTPAALTKPGDRPTTLPPPPVANGRPGGGAPARASKVPGAPSASAEASATTARTNPSVPRSSTTKPDEAPSRVGASDATAGSASALGRSLPGRSTGAGSSPVVTAAPPRPVAVEPTSDEASARLFPPEVDAGARPAGTPAGGAKTITLGGATTVADTPPEPTDAEGAGQPTSDTGPPTQPVSVIERGPAPRDDGFLDELRKAADDDPLGPMDAEADAAMQAFFTEDDEDLPKRPRFGRRR